MKIFVCEFITSGGFINQTLPTKLAKEGNMMLQAVVNDLYEINEFNITVTRDSRLESVSNVDEIIIINNDKKPYAVWEACFKEADICLIIAPETDNVLYKIHQLAEENDCDILGCNLDSIKLSGSKIRCLDKLNKFGLLTPETYYLEDAIDMNFPFVLKPDDGVGCENCFLIKTEHQMDTVLVEHPKVGRWIIQEYRAGINASVCILIYDNQFKILSINEQVIELNENKFILRSIMVNQYFDLKPQIEIEIKKILCAVPGLSGIIGIDCILSEKNISILEINPRLTTSYCGLSQSIDINPMKYLWDTYKSKRLDNIDIELLGSQIVTV